MEKVSGTGGVKGLPNKINAAICIIYKERLRTKRTRYGKNMVYETRSPEETAALAVQLAKKCVPGDIYCLDGDLGVGKTLFSQGFAKGLGITEPVNSPTFTIIQIYEEGRLPLYHFDVYRIGDVSEMDEIGYEDYFFGEGVCLIEWAELVEEIIPPEAHHIRIEKDMRQGTDYRRITVW